MIKQLLRSSLARSAGIYTFSTIINSAIPFFMMPVLTRYLTPTDYGIVAMFFVLLGIISPFIGLSLHGAISVKYFDKDEINLPGFIGNCFLLLLMSTILVSFVLWLFAGQISSLTAFPREWLLAVVFIAVGQMVILVVMTLWQVENKPSKYSIFQNLQTVVNISLAIFLVVGLGKNWQGRIEADIITTSIFAFAGYIFLYKKGWLKFRYDRSHMSYALKFGVPLIPHALGGMLMIQTDRIFITNMVSVADTGIYTVGFQIAMIIELFASSFNRAYVPWLYKHLGENDFSIKKKIVKYSYIYFVLIIVFALCVALLSPWFLSFFVGKKFAGAYKYTAWIAFGFAFSGMYYMVTNYIFYVGKNHLLAGVTFITALVNILLNYILIKWNGAVGAAQASAIAFFMSFVLTWLLSSRVYAMPWNLFKKNYSQK